MFQPSVSSLPQVGRKIHNLERVIILTCTTLLYKQRSAVGRLVHRVEEQSAQRSQQEEGEHMKFLLRDWRLTRSISHQFQPIQRATCVSLPLPLTSILHPLLLRPQMRHTFLLETEFHTIACP